MPPDSNSDFDVHLEQSLRDLKDLKLDMETDIFMFYSSLDVPAPGKEDQKVSPQKIYQDLVDEGFKVLVDFFFADISDESNNQQLLV